MLSATNSHSTQPAPSSVKARSFCWITTVLQVRQAWRKSLRVERPERPHQTQRGELDGGALLDQVGLARKQRRLGVGDLDLRGGAGLELGADEPLVLAREAQGLLRLGDQRAGRLQIELAAPQLVLDAHPLPARLRRRLALLARRLPP